MLICIFVGCSMVKGMIIHEGFKVRWPNWLWIRSTDSWGLSAGCLSMFHGKKPMVSLRFLLLHWIYLRRCMFEHWVLWAECEVVWVSCQSVLPDWLTLSVAFNHTCSLYLRIGWTGEVTGNARIFRGKKKGSCNSCNFPHQNPPNACSFRSRVFSRLRGPVLCSARSLPHLHCNGILPYNVRIGQRGGWYGGPPTAGCFFREHPIKMDDK